MHKLYTVKTISAPDADDSNMKTPRMSTINFLRNFARAYTFSSQTGAVILN